jgi:hypothetical protein
MKKLYKIIKISLWAFLLISCCNYNSEMGLVVWNNNLNWAVVM